MFAKKVRRLKKWLEEHCFLVAGLVTVLFVAIHVPLIMSHEMWYDEVVPWELSKEVSVFNYYEINRVEPHPPLWQLILLPFSQLGAPITVLSYISLLFVATAVFLLWWKAPFGATARLIMTLSILFFYFNPVIARDYSMVPLAVVLVCMTFGNRLKKPGRYGLALAFLAQTHFLMWGLVAALIVEFLWSYIRQVLESRKKERRKLKGVQLLWGGSVRFAIPVLIAVISCVPIIIGCVNDHMIVTGTTMTTNNPWEFFSYFNEAAFGLDLPIFELCLVFILLGLLISEHIKQFLIALFSLIYMAAIMMLVYNGYSHLEQKASLFFAVLLVVFWMIQVATNAEIPGGGVSLLGRIKAWITKVISHSEIIRVLHHYWPRASVAVMICVPFCFSVPHTLSMAVQDLNGNYDVSRELAETLNGFPEGSVFVLEDSLLQGNFVAVEPFLTNERRFYNTLYDEFGVNLVYDNDYYGRAANGVSDERMKSALMYLSNEFLHVYYIANRPTCENKSPQHDKILRDYERGEYEFYSYMDRGSLRYWVYQVK